MANKRDARVADERRQAKVTGDRGRWERLNNEFTKSAREDKNAYIESKCREMEKDKTNSKKAFRILKEVTGKRSVRSEVEWALGNIGNGKAPGK